MSICRTAPCADSTCFADDFSKFGWATETEKGPKKKFESHKYRKDGPMSPHLKPSVLQKMDF